jgi:hypothetical protein
VKSFDEALKYLAQHHPRDFIRFALGDPNIDVIKPLPTGLPARRRDIVPQTGLYTYAEGGVACGRWQIHTDGMCLLNPVLLFEVLSPATKDYDRGVKREHYQEIPSLRHLLIIDQPTHLIEHYHREPDGPWTVIALHEGTIHLPDLGGMLILDEIYLTDEDE